jgi:DNA polymerase III epsilon subunit-like protein
MVERPLSNGIGFVDRRLLDCGGFGYSLISGLDCLRCRLLGFDYRSLDKACRRIKRSDSTCRSRSANDSRVSCS